MKRRPTVPAKLLSSANRSFLTMTSLEHTLGGLAATTKRRMRQLPFVHSSIEKIRNRAYFSTFDIHEKMLADKARMAVYSAGIKKHVHAGDTVLDVGTGTGVLSFLAAKREPKQVYAIDHSEHILGVAKHLASANHIENVEFIRVHSRDFKTTEPLDVILHEQIGSELFNEDMIANICDLRDRLLKPGGRILPAYFQLFLEPVQLHANYEQPHIWDFEIEGIKFDSLAAWASANPISKGPDHRRIHPVEVDKLLCQPQSIYSFDLYTVDPSHLPQSWRQERKVVADGRIDGFCLYFRASFDYDIGLENGPFSPRTSWNCHFIRTPQTTVAAGETLTIEWTVPNLVNVRGWSVSLRHDGPADVLSAPAL